jgi:hypothetical protein
MIMWLACNSISSVTGVLGTDEHTSLNSILQTINASDTGILSIDQPEQRTDEMPLVGPTGGPRQCNIS